MKTTVWLDFTHLNPNDPRFLLKCDTDGHDTYTQHMYAFHLQEAHEFDVKESIRHTMWAVANCMDRILGAKITAEYGE